MSWIAAWRALVRLRLTLWWHGVRRRGDWEQAIVGAALNLVAAAGSVILAFAFAILLHRVVATRDAEALATVLLTVCSVMAFFALVMPAFLGAGRHGRELSRLLVFPLGRGTLFGLTLATSAGSGCHLFWYPSLLAVFIFGVARGPIDTAAGLIVLLLLAVALVLWGTVLLMLLEAVMRRRSARELIGVGALTLLAAVTTVSALADNGILAGGGGTPVLLDVLAEVLLPVATALPSSLAATALSRLGETGAAWSWNEILQLCAWIATGLALGHAVYSRVLLEPVHHGRHRSRATARTGAGRDVLSLLPPGLAAVLGKELRYLRRSTPGRLQLLLCPAFVVIIALGVGMRGITRQPWFGLDAELFALCSVLLYVSLLSANLAVNAFAWDGDGFKAYLMGPLNARHVMLGKNLALMAFELPVLAECLAAWSLVRGVPPAVTAASGIIVFYCGVLVLTTAGNFASIVYPVKRSIASISNSSSNIGTLVSFGAVALSVALVLPTLVLGQAAGGGAVQLLLLGLLLVILAVLKYVLLAPAADLFEVRSERLAATLEGAGS